MTVDNPAAGDNWGPAAFNGTVTGATFNANVVSSASFINANPARQITGSVVGGVTGFNGNTIGGVFDFEEAGTPTTHVEGVFVAR